MIGAFVKIEQIRGLNPAAPAFIFGLEE